MSRHCRINIFHRIRIRELIFFKDADGQELGKYLVGLDSGLFAKYIVLVVWIKRPNTFSHYFRSLITPTIEFGFNRCFFKWNERPHSIRENILYHFHNGIKVRIPEKEIPIKMRRMKNLLSFY